MGDRQMTAAAKPISSAEMLAKMKAGPSHALGECWSNIAKLGEKPRWVIISAPWAKTTA